MYKKIFPILILSIFLFSLFVFSVSLETMVSQDKNELEPKSKALDIEKILKEDGIYLTLEEVCYLALSNNFDIQLAQFDAQYKQTDLDDATSVYDTIIEAEAKFKDDQTKSSSSIVGTKSETREFNLGASKKLPTGTTLEMDLDNERSWTNSPYATLNPAHDSSAKITLKQELGKNFFGIKDRSDIKITQIDIENAQYTSLDKIEQTLSEVQKTYWQITRYIEVVRIKEDMLQKAYELYQINKEKIQKGIIEQPQLLASEANLKQKEIDLILAQNELKFYLNKLILLLNLEDKDKFILPRQNLGLSTQPPNLTEALKIAFDYRRDYIKAKNEVDSKDLKLVMQRNNLWPEINLEASVKRNGLGNHFTKAVEDITAEDNPEYLFSLKMKFPIENRKARSEFNKAKIEKAKALINIKKIERQILIQIKDSIRDCNVLRERARYQENVVELQKEKLAAELKRYQYGRSDTDTVIRYQDDLLTSELLYTQALLEYKEALIELSLKENSLLNHFWEDEL